MKIKTGQEIEEMADKYTKEMGVDAMSGYRFFSFKHGYDQAQKDLLESCSEGFEEFCEKNELSKFNENYKGLWQASRLGMMKEKSTNDYRMSQLEPAISEMHGWANFEHYVLKVRKEQQIEFENMQNEIKQLKEDLEWATKTLMDMTDPFESHYREFEKAADIYQRHGLKEKT